LVFFCVRSLAAGGEILHDGLTVLEDVNAELSLEEALSLHDSFHSLPRKTPHFAYSQSAFWFRVPLPESKVTQETQLLEIGYPLSSVTLYFQKAGGAWNKVETGEKFPYADRIFHYRNLVIPVPAGTESPVYLRVTSPTSIQLPLTLWSPQGFTEKATRHEFYFGLYFGLLGFMVLFNVIMAGLFRDRATLFYSLFLLSYALLQLNINRFASQFLWPHSAWLNYHSIPPSLGLTLLCMTVFCSQFLRVGKHYPRFNRILLGSGLVAALTGLSIFILPYRTVIFAVFFTVPLASLVTFAVSAWSLRTGRPAILFFLSWAPFMFGLWAIFLKAWGLIPSNFFTSYGIQIGSVFGVLLFSVSLADRFLRFRGEKERIEREAAIARTQAEQNLRLAVQAEQVAHDIRSPLTALDVAVTGLIKMPEQERILIRSAVTRIKDIANNLSEQRAKTQNPIAISPDASKIASHWLWGLIEPVVSEKRLQFHQKASLRLEATFAKDVATLYSRVNPQELKRVLSNLVNNSCEAIDKNGRISIQLEEQGPHHITIVVADNGKGIPAAILPKLMGRGVSFGKEGGSGLGLHHAKNAVHSWGGTIAIDSKEGEGTRVTLTLPKSTAPEWCATEVTLRRGQIAVVVDDDPSIFEVWRSRLSGLVDFAPPIHFTSPQAFKSWFQNSTERNFVIFCDFEFRTPPTGVELIRELGIASICYLVTSRHEDPDIQHDCQEMKLSLIPKNMAPLITINLIGEMKSPSLSKVLT